MVLDNIFQFISFHEFSALTLGFWKNPLEGVHQKFWGLGHLAAYSYTHIQYKWTSIQSLWCINEFFSCVVLDFSKIYFLKSQKSGIILGFHPNFCDFSSQNFGMKSKKIGMVLTTISNQFGISTNIFKGVQKIIQNGLEKIIQNGSWHTISIPLQDLGILQSCQV